MGPTRWALSAVLCFCGLVTGNEVWSVGPCDVITEVVFFNCSGRKLSKIPWEIWDNTTALDLSQNHLNLSTPKNLRALSKFSHLVQLNLSGNILPWLEKDMFYRLPSLRTLDLSGCQLHTIQAGALRAFPLLKMLLLANNRLQDLPPSILQDLKALIFQDVHNNSDLRPSQVWKLENKIKEFADGDSVDRIQRKLLIEDNPTTPGRDSQNNSSQTRKLDTGSAHGWTYLLGAVGTLLAVFLLVMAVVKCKVFQNYLASYRHALLSEVDATSQCDPAALEVGFSGYGTQDSGHAPPHEQDDDDGFIEDNYIQASERERAEREMEEEGEEDGFEEDDIQFSIG